MRRVVSILCVCAMFIAMLPMMALSASASPLSSGDFLYEVIDGKAEITWYTGSATVLTIPSTLGGYTVTRIGWCAFAYDDWIKSITIPSSVTSIGAYAFFDCTSLQSVKIGSGVKTIDEQAFSGCDSLKNITIPNSVTSIGVHAFSNCPSLQSVALGSGVKTIGEQAFSGCASLKNITIPNSVTSMGALAFSGCSSLQSVKIGSGVKTIGEQTFYYCESLQSVTIPNSVTSIGPTAFAGCTSLERVSFGSGVKTIGDQAFYCCTSLKSVTIPHNVTSVGEYAFESCQSLQSITIGSGLKSIGRRALRACESLKTITVNSKNTAYCSVNGILFTKNKKTLVLYPAQKTATSYTIPSSVKNIEETAFANCTSLKSITIPSKLEYIGESAFSNCVSLRNIIPNSESIGRYAFLNCTSLQRVVIPNGAVTIGPEAFGYCTSLKSITIPNSVINIGWDVFYDCSVFSDVYYSGTRTQWDAINDGSYNDFIPSGVNVHYNCSFAKITAQSATAAYANHNANASVKVTAKGDGLSYTWYIKNPGQTTYSKSSVTSATYTAKMTAENSGRLAYCIVKDKYGNEVRSKTFELRRKATITSESATVVYVKHNANASAKVAAQGDGLSYAWYVKKAGDTAYSKSSVTTATYTAKMTAGNSGSLVCCIVKDRYGNKVQSKTFLLRRKATVTSEPATAAYAKKGKNVSVKIGAAGDGLSYTWYFKNANGTKYAKSSVKSATYSATMSDTVKGRRVYCVVKDKYGKTVQTKTFLLREAASIVTQPKSTAAAKGATAKVTVKASGDGLKYAWYIKNAGQTKYTKSSVTKATYSATMNAAVKDRYVYCVVTDQYGYSVRTKTVVLREAATPTTTTKATTTTKKPTTTTKTTTTTTKTTTTTTKAYSNGLWYTVTDGKAEVTWYTGSATAVSIPSTLGGYPVTSIGAGAFKDCYSLESVTIPEGVTYVGEWAFICCSSLKSLSIPSSLTDIEYQAFSWLSSLATITVSPDNPVYCSENNVWFTKDKEFLLLYPAQKTATSYNIPDGVTYISNEAFAGCAFLEHLTIPDSVTDFGQFAFSGCCSLKSLTIPSSVTSFSMYTFGGCCSLADVYYSGTKAEWNNIFIGEEGEVPTTAAIHYNCAFAKITDESATAAYASDNENASVKVTATGDGLSYTWYFKDPGQTKYAKSSITSATYKAKMTAESAGRLVYCVVKDKYGNKVQSKTFVLRRKATITSEPSSAAVYANNGAQVSVSIDAVGDGLTYTWYIKNAGQTKYTKSSVTKATYSTTMNAASKDRLVYCVVTDKYGKTARSNTVQLKMK